MVLAFALGFIAIVIKSDLKLPDGLYASLSIYLLFAIGLKGGVALSQARISDLWGPVLATLGISVVTPALAYNVCRRFGRLDRTDSAAMAAHYGSVSAVTFIAATSFAQIQGLSPEGFLPALVAILEVPAILFALWLVLRKEQGKTLGPLLHELLTGRAIVLLVGGLLIGLLASPSGMQQVEPLFGDLFKGALTIFLLEMGLVAGSKVPQLQQNAAFLLLFGTLVPLANGALGVAAGVLVGLSIGGAGVLGAMAASASYIAAPAAVRIMLPRANASLYLTGAIAVTFPFNLVVGIPVYLEIAKRLGSGG
ncbi:MAG: sodium-dependent bicarbonate transport family permease [Armatimonadetes bacterium]|nr:sodium-dependent bicarbonate transport family permease [Armatimonadota bacterium]